MSDLIDRQAAISAICSACGKIDCDKMDKCEKLQLPPANCSEIPNRSDTISRQAAIDAVNNAFDRETLLTGFVRSIAVRAIRDMPSAQPEPTDEQVEEYCKRRCLHIVTDDFFHTVQPEPQKGKWEQVSAQKYFTSASYIYRCSVCGENNPRNTKYCPNCGADMRGEKDERTD